jgi:hypothetical protein
MVRLNEMFCTPLGFVQFVRVSGDAAFGCHRHSGRLA